MALNLGIHLPPRNHWSFHSLGNTAGGEGEKPSWKINWEMLRAKELISVSVLLPVPCSARCHFPLVFLTFRSVWQLIKFHTWSDPALGSCHIPAAALWGHRPSVSSEAIVAFLIFFATKLSWSDANGNWERAQDWEVEWELLLSCTPCEESHWSLILSCAVNIPPLNLLKFSPSGIGQALHSRRDHLGAGWECSEKEQASWWAFPLPLS